MIFLRPGIGCVARTFHPLRLSRVHKAGHHARFGLSPARGFSSETDLREPLRILFCGSDAFSCESLRALHAEHGSNPSLIQSLDVLVRPGKRFGRGLKKVRQVPCKTLAEELQLQIHERDTFTGWDLPEGVNLVIAVSFGLFVPPRILKSATYRGLNVHPSYLPHLRGPAPIAHALLRGDKFTGVTLQTLDDKAFDHGSILFQTPRPGFAIDGQRSLPDVSDELAKHGAQALVQGLREGLYLQPPQEPQAAATEEDGLAHAPKLTKQESEVDLENWTADDFRRRLKVFPTLWADILDGSPKGEAEASRVLFIDAKVVQSPPELVLDQKDKARCLVFARADGEATYEADVFVQTLQSEQKEVSVKEREELGMESYVLIRIKSDEEQWLRVDSIKVAGKSLRCAPEGLRRFIKSKAPL